MHIYIYRYINIIHFNTKILEYVEREEAAEYSYIENGNLNGATHTVLAAFPIVFAAVVVVGALYSTCTAT